MQNLEIQNYSRQVALLLPDTTKRRLILPTLIGMAIGNFLQIKLGNEVNPLTAFNDAHLGNVSRAVSYLNEEVYLDVKVATEAARAQFMIRNRIVNCQPTDYSANPEFDFMAIALGLSVVIPVETYNAIKETGLSAGKVLSLSNLLIAKLKEAKQITI